MTIFLIDYGAGNLTSVRKALRAIGVETVAPDAPADLARADGLIVPGVGHFKATAALDASWREAILRAIERGTPLLGICLGMQWLFDGSTEAPGLPGLGVLPGTCRRLSGLPAADGAAAEGLDAGASPEPGARSPMFKIPHVGWNTFRKTKASLLLEGVADGAYAYFTHSYAAPVTPATAAVTTYGETFASVVEQNHIFGVQFHPEKSSEPGLQMLRNFLARVDLSSVYST